ncbi:MAG: hypothetical protein R2788_04985 [Saprospiraceae bacterium]
MDHRCGQSVPELDRRRDHHEDTPTDRCECRRPERLCHHGDAGREHADRRDPVFALNQWFRYGHHAWQVRRPVSRVLALEAQCFPLDHRCGQFVPELDRRRDHHEGYPTDRCECRLDQNACTTTATLAGNTPSVGTGSLSLVSTRYGHHAGQPDVRCHGPWLCCQRFPLDHRCGQFVPELDRRRDHHEDTPPTAANAVPDQNVCATTATLAGNTPTVGTGSWSLISIPVRSPRRAARRPVSRVLALRANVFRWTIDAGNSCPNSTDDVTITRDTPPTAANAYLPTRTSVPPRCDTGQEHADRNRAGYFLSLISSWPGTVTTPWQPNVRCHGAWP